jgi:hypothetical protein
VTLERRKAAEERKRAEELKAQVRVGPIPTHPVSHRLAWCQKSNTITEEGCSFQESCTLTVSVSTRPLKVVVYEYEASSLQTSYTSHVVSGSPVVNDLSSPTITLSQSGHALARVSSSSDLNFSSRFPAPLSTSAFLCVPPIPGIHPAGDVMTVTSASGIMRSRSRSPAESKLRPMALV